MPRYLKTGSVVRALSCFCFWDKIRRVSITNPIQILILIQLFGLLGYKSVERQRGSKKEVDAY
jgi:hypothetical protein